MPVKPGGPPPDAPAAFSYLKDERLLTNGNITRMPTTQREWNTFIQELDKWLKNKTDGFGIGGSNTAQWTGFSSDPSDSTGWYQRFGQVVHLEFDGVDTGTSNATSFTITGIPAEIRPRDDITVYMAGLIDAGADITTGSLAKVGSDGVVTFYSNTSGGGWTGSGAKGFDTLVNYSIIYMLRNPPKL